jgi:hypothetical protein
MVGAGGRRLAILIATYMVENTPMMHTNAIKNFVVGEKRNGSSATSDCLIFEGSILPMMTGFEVEARESINSTVSRMGKFLVSKALSSIGSLTFDHFNLRIISLPED